MAALLTLAALLLAGHHHTHAQGSSPVTVAAIALSIRSRAIQDSRCYLMNGGAVESFFISEDTPVGSIIGTLSVNGDPSESGDISLRLQEQGAGVAVGVARGSKNLTLLRPLDREQLAGPASVYVNVRCDRRPSTDPSFIIPVSVRVWDVNDNAPQWTGAPYRVRLSELTAPGTPALRPRASDRDLPGPHALLHYSVRPAAHSEYFYFPNELEGVLVVNKSLDYETLKNFTVTLRVQDQGTPPLHNDTVLEVEVLDADDQNPKFTHEHYTAIIPEDAEPGMVLETQPGPISARDQDEGIDAPLQYAAGGAGGLLAVEPDSGRVLLTAALLAATPPNTFVLKATQVDNPDRYALATLSLTRETRSTPAPAVRFEREHHHAAVPEDTAPPALLLALRTRPPPTPQNPLQFYVSDRSFLEKFAINSAGEVLLRRPLDYETKDSYYYQVMVTDGKTNDTTSINITVLNVNEWEPRFRFPQYEFEAGNTRAVGGLLPVGRLDVHDGDAPDTVALTLRGPHASMLEVNELGELFLREEALEMANTSVLHVVATAQDSGQPPRQTSVPVVVHLGARAAVGGAGVGGGAGGAAVAACGAALALLALLLAALLLYICRHKRKTKADAVQSKANSGFVSHEKLRSAGGTGGPQASGGSAGPVGGGGGLAAAGNSGSLLSVSAGASTILANSTSSLDLRSADTNTAHIATSGRASQRFPHKSKVSPLQCSAPNALMSDHLRGDARSPARSGVAWPAGTIPARVRALAQDSGEPTAEATNNALSEQMNLTVYF